MKSTRQREAFLCNASKWRIVKAVSKSQPEAEPGISASPVNTCAAAQQQLQYFNRENWTVSRSLDKTSRTEGESLELNTQPSDTRREMLYAVREGRQFFSVS